jgi:predicted DNA-binding antitoxin AbrB/MazE fold protein
MSYDIDAIYDNGVFRPLEPLAIPDGVRVHLRVSAANEEGRAINEFTNEHRAELDDLRRVMAELPVESPNDGFSGADHDRLLYGKP